VARISPGRTLRTPAVGRDPSGSSGEASELTNVHQHTEGSLSAGASHATEADRFRGCLLGLATGDALGTTLEFRRRDSYSPLTDMVGGGPFNLQPGEWTDDTSMALCLATSLVSQPGFDASDQMKRYCDWADSGYLSSNGRCFDIGNTIRRALGVYRSTGEPFAGPVEPNAAGNGSLMRLAPVVMFFYPRRDLILHFARESSRTTHGAGECVEACQLFAAFLTRALGGDARQGILSPVPIRFTSPRIQEIADLEFLGRERSEIRSSGYVVHCLEAALWCFSRTTSFADAVLLAANLGDDADTTAAVCGQLAGAHYGASAIPDRWLRQLAMYDAIATLANSLWCAAPS